MRLLIEGGKFYGDPEAYRALMDYMTTRGVDLSLNACELLPAEPEVVDAVVVDCTGDEVEVLEPLN